MKLRPFELALIVIFGILMLLSLVLLRSYKATPDENVVTLGGPVSIWGTLPDKAFLDLIQELATENNNYHSVSYRYIPAEDFDKTFINALADGNGPDLLFINQEFLVQHRNRIESVPYTSFPLRDFKTNYVDGAEIFALADGIYGYPIAVDPLMLYWNRDIFTEANRLTPPGTWEEVVGEVVPALTIRDFNFNITQSALALGEYDNIKNAFPILSLLLLQAGSSMVIEKGKQYQVALDKTASTQARPLAEVVSFYINFNNVANTLYSWNKSLPEDRELFLNEKLALYFGFGSEARLLANRNPNLNFDIAPVPQGATVTASAKRTYGLFYAFMVPMSAANKTGAYTVRTELSSQVNAKKIADAYDLAPVSRASLMAGSNDIYGRQTYASVAQTRGWLNPNKNQTDEVFKLLLNDISTNRSNVYTATSDAIQRLQQVY